MNISFPGESTAKISKLPANQLSYYNWLRDHLKKLHQDLKLTKEEVKSADKFQYDIKHRVKEPEWAVGDKVLLLDKRVKPHSDNVLTLRPYRNGPFFIVQIVKGDDDVDTAYKLTHCVTGKSCKRLVASDRRKRFVDRKELDKRLPLLIPESSPDTTTEPQSSPVQRMTLSQDSQRDASSEADIPSGCESAKRVLKERVKGGKSEYFVEFSDGSRYWADYITDSLLQHWRLVQHKRRSRRQRKILVTWSTFFAVSHTHLTLPTKRIV